MGLGGGLAVLQGFFYYLGGRLDSFRKEADEFERKEIIRRTTRVPIEQTISEIGEGRGKSRNPQHHHFPNTTQASDLPATRRGGHSDSRRSTVSRLTLSLLPLTAANKHVRANGRERLYITLLGGEEMLH